MKKTISSLWLAAGALGSSAVNVFAVEDAAKTGSINLNAPGEFSKLGNITITTIVAGAIRLVLIVASLIFFFMLVWGGIQWMMSGGDKNAAEQARSKITNALVGLVIVFSAWAIMALIKNLFGVDIMGGLEIPSFQSFQ
jgi:hypothetical protein